jgi:hypothetical protein
MDGLEKIPSVPLTKIGSRHELPGLALQESAESICLIVRGVATLPVPIAQMGSYAITTEDQSFTLDDTASS